MTDYWFKLPPNRLRQAYAEAIKQENTSLAETLINVARDRGIILSRPDALTSDNLTAWIK